MIAVFDKIDVANLIQFDWRPAGRGGKGFDCDPAVAQVIIEGKKSRVNSMIAASNTTDDLSDRYFLNAPIHWIVKSQLRTYRIKREAVDRLHRAIWHPIGVGGLVFVPV